jgi:hypothetical protein
MSAKGHATPLHYTALHSLAEVACRGARACQGNVKVAWDYFKVEHMGAYTLSSQLVLGGIFSPGLVVGGNTSNIAADYMEPQIATREWLLELMRGTRQIPGWWSGMDGLAATS